MNPRIVAGIPGLLMLLAPAAGAQDSELVQGAALYEKECMICHGSAARELGERAPHPQQWQRLYAAWQPAPGATRSDAAGVPALPPGHAAASPARLAFSPPYGPTLRGVYGRAAGSVEGFSYSNTFMKTLKGMEWNEATLNVYLTDTQAWVPGVYMFYRQKDAQIRRKIIEYLKANR